MKKYNFPITENIHLTRYHDYYILRDGYKDQLCISLERMTKNIKYLTFEHFTGDNKNWFVTLKIEEEDSIQDTIKNIICNYVNKKMNHLELYKFVNNTYNVYHFNFY